MLVNKFLDIFLLEQVRQGKHSRHNPTLSRRYSFPGQSSASSRLYPPRPGRPASPFGLEMRSSSSESLSDRDDRSDRELVESTAFVFLLLDGYGLKRTAEQAFECSRQRGKLVASSS